MNVKIDGQFESWVAPNFRWCRSCEISQFSARNICCYFLLIFLPTWRCLTRGWPSPSSSSWSSSSSFLILVPPARPPHYHYRNTCSNITGSPGPDIQQSATAATAERRMDITVSPLIPSLTGILDEPWQRQHLLNWGPLCQVAWFWTLLLVLRQLLDSGPHDLQRLKVRGFHHLSIGKLGYLFTSLDLHSKCQKLEFPFNPALNVRI